MRVIWKYELHPDVTVLDMPIGATPLSVGQQGQGVVLWALVDPNEPSERRAFVAIPTGSHLDAGPMGRFIGTVQLRADMPLFRELVFHVFEATEVTA